MAASLLRRSGLKPGAAPSEVARALGFEVKHRRLPGSRLGFTIPCERKKLIVSPTGYRPRDEFSCAHELVEAHVPRRLGAAEHEQWCDRAAAALLLPRRAFLTSAFRSEFDLPRLKRRWRHASWEVLARRLADLVPGLSCCKWDADAPVWRYGAIPPAVTRAEVESLELARRQGHARALVDHYLAAAWTLSGGGSRRYAVTLCLPA